MSDKFEYNYESPTQSQRDEIESIRSYYLPKTKKTATLDRLRKLDFKAKNIPMIIGLTIGVIGILLFGVCITFFLEWSKYYYYGIPFGIMGIILMIFAYPIHNKMIIKLKEKYKDEVLKLSEILLKSNEEDN